MATRKSMKKSETSKSERELVVKLHEEGKSYQEIAKHINRSKSTVHYIIKKSKNEGSILNNARTGRPKKLTSKEEKLVIREIRKNPCISAPQLAGIIAVSFGKDVHAELCRRILRNNDYHGRIPRKKSDVDKVNMKKRLGFARNSVDRDNRFWDKVISSDDNKFKLFGADGQHHIWRKKNTQLEK